MVRRKFSAEFKQQIVRECQETGNISMVARKHELNSNMVRRWVNQFKQSNGTLPGKSFGKPTHVTVSELQQVVSERDELASEVDQMKKVLGEQALEIAILRDLVKKANPQLRKK